MFPVSSLYLLSILLNLMFNMYFLVHMYMYVDQGIIKEKCSKN